MHSPRLPHDTPFLDEVLRLLARNGPLSFASLIEALGEDPDDPDWYDDLDGLVEGSSRVVALSDERLADVVSLLDPLTLTRRISEPEAAAGYLELAGDLQPIVAVLEASMPLARGGRVRVSLAATPGRAAAERLVGPPGWLGDAGPGDLVGLRLADALLHVAVRPAPGKPDVAAAALAAAASPVFADSAETGFDPPRAPLVTVLWEAIAAAPAGFAGVLPPLSEVAGGAGLHLTETMVLPAPADGRAIPATTDAVHDAIARVYHGASDALLADLARLRASGRRAEAGEVLSAEELRAAVAALGDPVVLDCFVRELTLGGNPVPLATAAADSTTGAARAGALFVQAAAARRAGDAPACETALRAALEDDPGLQPALVELARLTDVRGDAAEALRLLVRAGEDGSVWANALRGYTRGPRAPRNAPCPCGSGRKTKVCCGGQAGGPLAQRAAWLFDKLRAYADRLPLAQRLEERLDAADRLTDWAEGADSHPLLADVVVFDLGVLEDFLAEWGPLLPADERDLAEQWRASRRGLYRVETVRGPRATLTDRRDGTRLEARVAGTAPAASSVVLARLLPDGAGGHLLVAGVLVDEEAHPAVAAALDPRAHALDVADLWGGDQPVVTNTEGEATLVIDWQARCDHEAAGRLRGQLLAAGLEEQEPGSFVETVDVGGQRKVRGTVTVGDGLVRVDTNSELRLGRLVGWVSEAAGELEVVVDRRTPLWRAIADQRAYGVPPEPTEPSAQEIGILDGLLREQESAWVDEPVPALGNLTPREAADHPTGRGALERLLAEQAAGRGTFGVDRLRDLLDLAPQPAHPAAPAEPAARRGGRTARRVFAFPTLDGVHDGIDLGMLDPADDDARFLHVEGEHAATDAWGAGDPYHEPGADPTTHHALHVAIAWQLWEDDPPQAWACAQRLTAAGYDRHEVLHMLGSALADELWHARRDGRAFDLRRYAELLDALPESWEIAREEGRRPGRPRGGRRPPAGHGG